MAREGAQERAGCTIACFPVQRMGSIRSALQVGAILKTANRLCRSCKTAKRSSVTTWRCLYRQRQRMSQRETLHKKYHQLYRLAPSERSEHGWPLCVYCGQPADTMDHVPPLSRVDDYRAMGVAWEAFLLVKACRPCNLALGDSLQRDVLERIQVLKDLLSKGGRREFVRDLWDEDEVNELGKNLRSLVGSKLRKEQAMLERIEYRGGLRALLSMSRDEHRAR